MKKTTRSLINSINFYLFSSILLLVLLVSQVFAQRVDDDFTSGALNNWSNIGTTEGWGVSHLQNYDVNASQAGKLVMKPLTSTWYEDRMGGYLYQNVNGNFVFTTIVNVSGSTGSTIASNSHYSLGGIMVRLPKTLNNGGPGWTAGHENYISLMVGYGDPSGPCSPGAGLHIMVNNTSNSMSNMCLSPVSGGTVQLRIARVNSAIICLSRVNNGAWQVIHRENRVDFGQDVQVGFATMSDWDKASTYSASFANSHDLTANLSPDPSSNYMLGFHPDLTVGFEYAKWNNPTVPANLSGVDLVSGATDNQLLSFLSFEVSSSSNNGGGTANGINEVNQANNYYLSSTITSNQIQINATTSTNFTIEIYNAFGQLVMNTTNTGAATVMDVQTLATGIYFVKAGTSTLKFIKQ